VRGWLLVSTVVVILVCAVALDAADGVAPRGDHDGTVERHCNCSDEPQLLERNDHCQCESRWSSDPGLRNGWLRHCDDGRWFGVRGYVAWAGPDLRRPGLEHGVEQSLRLPLHRHPQSDSKWIHIGHCAVCRGPR
jgi:hypothetical protein